MGLPMAQNLQRKGFPIAVVGHSRREPVEILKRDGAIEAITPKELAQKCDVIFSMVFSAQQTEEVVFGYNGVWQELGGDHTLIICSTVTPDFCRELAERVKREKGADVLDAPVSGAPWGAEAGTLTFMVGGSETAYQRCKQFFEAMGKNIFYAGKSGTGQAAKLANNLMAIVNIGAAFEAVSLAKKADLDTHSLLEMVKLSTGDSYVVRNWDNVVKLVRTDSQKGTAYKDLDAALDFARRNGLRLPIAGLVSQLEYRIPPE